jgi:pimeloyl-ACP methyl ester carboxylesterase
MKAPKKYGKPPYRIVVVHGGPGAAGSMAPVAKRISLKRGVLEPVQTEGTVEGQIRELRQILRKKCQLPVILVGWSWGAWLCYMLAARYPALVKKLILISSGPFEEKYARTILESRLSRMSETDNIRFKSLKYLLENRLVKSKDQVFAALGKLLAKSDSYDPVKSKSDHVSVRYDIYRSVWPEADALRRSGALLNLGKKILCPVVAIHGDYDPHPYKGVKTPLRNVLNDFRFILLQKCGHQPWAERFAREKFFRELEEELTSNYPTVMKINKQWHEANKMPKNPSLDERIRWHKAHAKQCACRPVPEKILQEIAGRKKKTT